MSSNHKIKTTRVNFLSTGRINEGMERGIGGGPLRGKNLTSKTSGNFQSYVFPLGFPGLIRLPRTLVQLFLGSHFTIKSQI